MSGTEKKIGKYLIGRVLGKGNFSKVRLATDSTNNEKYAIKIIDKALLARDHLEDQIRREISIMKVLRHRYIVQMREAFQTTKHMYVVMELVEGGELFDVVADQGRLTEDMARKYFQQLIVAVRYCHANKIAHRDLKLENLLLDIKGNLKISDFGLANMQVTPDSSVLRTVCGTPNYVAPEVIKLNSMPKNSAGERTGGYNGFTADVWSCGIILFIMLSGRQAFDDDDLRALFNKIERGQYQMSRHIPEGAKPLIERMLDTDPSRRYTVEDIIKHPWFQRNFDPADLAAGGPSITQPDEQAVRNAVTDVDVSPNASPVNKGGMPAAGGGGAGQPSLGGLQQNNNNSKQQQQQQPTLRGASPQQANLASGAGAPAAAAAAASASPTPGGIDGFQLASSLIASALTASPFVDLGPAGPSSPSKAAGGGAPASPTRRASSGAGAASSPPACSAYASYGSIRQYLIALPHAQAQAAAQEWLKTVLPSAMRNGPGSPSSPGGGGGGLGSGGQQQQQQQQEMRGFMTTTGRGILTWVMEVHPTAAAGLSLVQAKKGMGADVDFADVLRGFAKKMADAKVLASELRAPPPGQQQPMAGGGSNTSPKSSPGGGAGMSPPTNAGGLGSPSLPAITSQRKVMAPGGK